MKTVYKLEEITQNNIEKNTDMKKFIKKMTPMG